MKPGGGSMVAHLTVIQHCQSGRGVQNITEILKMCRKKLLNHISYEQRHMHVNRRGILYFSLHPPPPVPQTFNTIDPTNGPPPHLPDQFPGVFPPLPPPPRDRILSCTWPHGRRGQPSFDAGLHFVPMDKER